MDNQQPSLELRECKKCGAKKPLSEFNIYHRAGYRRHTCAVCLASYHKKWRDGEVEAVIPNAKSRTCKVCGATKPTGDFARIYAKSSKGKDYRSHTCHRCHLKQHSARAKRLRAADPQKFRAYRKLHRQANLEKVRRQRRESGKRLKDICFAAYGGHLCVCCGEIEPSMLTLDHIYNDGNEHRNSLNGGRGRKASVDMYRRLKDSGFPKGLQVLCYNCNMSKHRNGGTCAHKLKEGSTTIPQGSTLQAIGSGSARPLVKQG